MTWQEVEGQRRCVSVQSCAAPFVITPGLECVAELSHAEDYVESGNVYTCPDNTAWSLDTEGCTIPGPKDVVLTMEVNEPAATFRILL